MFDENKMRQLDAVDGNIYLKKPKTITFETRADIRSLALVARYLHKIGIPCYTKSALGTSIIEGFAERLLEKGEEPILTSLEANQVLDRLGVSRTLREQRSLANLQSQMDLENALERYTNPPDELDVDAIAERLLSNDNEDV